MLPPAVSSHYRALQRLQVATVGLTRREWARMGTDFDTSWRTVGPRLVLLTGSAQLGAARSGERYVPDALEQQGIRAVPDGDVVPAGFAGFASDGRDLDGLLYGAVTTAKQQVAAGQDPAAALQAGGRALDMYVQTMVTDAARQAASVAIAARPRVGWTRMVNPPCCSRCAILAGKWFGWNHGFQRHPRCDCTHIPTTENAAGDVRTDADALFRQGQVRVTEAQKHALDLGADPGQVINASRGMTADGLYTSEGTTRRGYASHVKRRLAEHRGEAAAETVTNVGRRGARANYRVRRVGPRPTPEAIYRYSTDRDDALQLLAANGYLRAA